MPGFARFDDKFTLNHVASEIQAYVYSARVALGLRLLRRSSYTTLTSAVNCVPSLTITGRPKPMFMTSWWILTVAIPVCINTCGYRGVDVSTGLPWINEITS